MFDFRPSALHMIHMIYGTIKGPTAAVFGLCLVTINVTMVCDCTFACKELKTDILDTPGKYISVLSRGSVRSI